jgi:outer membrane protein
MYKHSKMIRILTLGMLLAGLLPPASAQQSYSFSAKEAVDHALKHVTEIRNLQIDRDIRLAANKEITGAAYPQVTGSVSMQKFFDIPVTLLPDFVSPAVYGVLQDKGVKDGSGNAITAPNTPPQFFPAQFGVPWQSTAGISFQQLLFQPDVFVGLQARAGSVKLADLNIRIMEDSVKSSVSRAYYGVLIAEKRRIFLSETLDRFARLMKDQEKLFANGFAERLDIEKTQVALNNLQTTKSQLDNLITLGYASLKFVMGLNQADTLKLRDSLTADLVKGALLQGADFKYDDRPEMQLLNTATDLQRLDVKRYKLQYIPTVAAFWNVSRNALRQEFNFFDGDQPWFKTNLAGLNVSVPIFDGFQKQSRIKQAQLRLEKTENDKAYLQRAIDLQREVSLSVLRNALASLDVQERNMKLAEKVFLTTKKKYEQGLGSSFEILQADQEFQLAQGNYFQALYDAMNAKIGYNRAIGKL